MMLVEHDRVEANFFGKDRFVEIFAVKLRALFCVEEFVGQAEKGAVFDYLVFGHVAVGAFGEIHIRIMRLASCGCEHSAPGVDVQLLGNVGLLCPSGYTLTADRLMASTTRMRAGFLCRTVRFATLPLMAGRRGAGQTSHIPPRRIPATS